MFYSLLVFIFLFLEIVFASFLLSQYVCSRNNFFESNVFGRWMIGILVYFTLSVVIFFPFTFFIKVINIVYLIVIFLLKDFFIYLFLFLRRSTYLKFNKEYLTFISTIFMTVIFWIIYFFGFTQFIETKKYLDDNMFNFLNIFDKVVTRLFFEEEVLFAKILLQFITILIICNVIMTFVYEISSHQSWIENVIGFFVILISILMFNFQKEIQFNIFIYIVLFALILMVRFVLFSRRRYAIMFGLSTLIAYSFDRSSIIPLASVDIIGMLIYTFLKKPKISVFWIVLLIPIIFVIALDLYNVSYILSIIVSGLLIYFYIFILNTGRNITFSKIDSFIIRYKWFIPAIVASVLFLIGFLNLINYDYKIENFETIYQSIFSFSNGTSHPIMWTEFTFYLIISLTNICLTTFLLLKKKSKINRTYLLMIFTSLFLLFVYNPLTNAAFQREKLLESFNITKVIIFIPLFILSITFLKNNLKNFILNKKTDNQKNIQEYYH